MCISWTIKCLILHDSLKLLNLRPAVCFPMQKAVTLSTCCTVGKCSAEQRTRRTWSVRPVEFENRLNYYEVRNVDNENNDNKDESDV